MASRYDDLDASLELEQRLSADLRAALEPRGCEVTHNGTNAGGRHSPGGKPDIEIHDRNSNRIVLVEVTKRRGSAADGEFAAVTDHLNRTAAANAGKHVDMLYISPATSARMSMNFRDLYNRNRERDNIPGRIVAIDFEAAQLFADKLAKSDPALYPARRFGELFDRWADAIDDARARQLIQSTFFPEDSALALELAEEAQEFDAQRERDLKKNLEKVENSFRSHGITGNNANITLVYLAFIRLFEERRQKKTGRKNRFSLDGFHEWCDSIPATMRSSYRGRFVSALLHEIAEDVDLREAGLLQRAGGIRPDFHEKLTDSLVESLILPMFDEYDFHAGRVDVLGAVFETLARRSEKDTRVGQFFTPQQVVDFCANLVELRPTDVVLDPAVGTGRFLIASMERMLDNADESLGNQADVERSIRQRQLFGADIDGWVATIAKMNMFIHGDGKSGIGATNGLVLGDQAVFSQLPDGLNAAVDVVLTNPPLGDTDFTVAERAWEELGGDPDEAASYYEWLGVVPLEVVEQVQLEELRNAEDAVLSAIADLEAQDPQERPRGALARAYKKREGITKKLLQLQVDIAAGKVTRRPRGRTLKGGALFLGAIQQYLKPARTSDLLAEWQGGRVALVVDEAVLNTPDYAFARAFIRKHFFIKAVISLSRDAFKYLAHTDAKTSVVYLIKKPNPNLEQREPIFFSHAERVGYSAVGQWVGDDLPQVLLQYEVFKDAVLGSYEDRYLASDKAIVAAKSLPGHGHGFYARLDSARDLSGRLDFYDARFRQRRDELLEKHGALVRLGDFLDVAPRVSPEASRNGEYDFAVATRTGTIAYKGRTTVAYPPRALWIVEAGELVLSSIDLVNGAVAVAGDDVAGLVMSKEMYAYRPKPGVKVVPEYLQILLRTQAAREMLLGFTTGTSNRTRLESPHQLLNFPLPPLPTLDEQVERATQLREAYAMQRTALEQLASLHLEAQEAWGPPSPRVGPADERSQPVASARPAA